MPVKRLHEVKQELTGLIASEFGEAPLFVVKDPRICRYAPLFLEVLEEAQITPRVVHIVRNPLEVADSLHRRDELSRTDGLLREDQRGGLGGAHHGCERAEEERMRHRRGDCVAVGARIAVLRPKDAPPSARVTRRRALLEVR